MIDIPRALLHILVQHPQIIPCSNIPFHVQSKTVPVHSHFDRCPPTTHHTSWVRTCRKQTPAADTTFHLAQRSYCILYVSFLGRPHVVSSFLLLSGHCLLIGYVSLSLCLLLALPTLRACPLVLLRQRKRTYASRA